MPNYDFRTLSFDDFEKLTVDLLQKELGVTLEAFKKGKDGGIDARYSTVKDDNNIIIQAKHYLKSGPNKLISALKKELPKVKKLKPENYIISTSVELSPNQKKEIKDIFKGYVKRSGDIYDGKLLNNLLGKFPEVEKDNFKLWMSSINILETVLNKANFIHSTLFKEEIADEMRLYVETPSLSESFEKLGENNFIVITGEPGVGKTFLAKALILNLLKDEYELVHIQDNNINEHTKMMKLNDEKQVFFLDDFLGSNSYDIFKSNYDSEILQFIKRIQKGKNKLLILTSRTNILQEGKTKIVRLNEGTFLKSEYEVNVRKYNSFIKAQVLYNHLFFNLDDEILYDKIRENKFYKKIIQHKNFNPRLIEYITKPDNLEDQDRQDYLNYIYERLENPDYIWERPYNNLNFESKIFLHTLSSFPGSRVNEKYFKKAFFNRLKYETKHNNYVQEPDVYTNSLRILNDCFIKRETIEKQYSSNTVTYIDFANPGIKDFIIQSIFNEEENIVNLIKSSFYIEQLEEVSSFIPVKATSGISNILIDGKETFLSLESIEVKNKPLTFLYVFLRATNGSNEIIENEKDFISSLLVEINFGLFGIDQTNYITYICERLYPFNVFNDYFYSKLREMATYAFSQARDVYDIEPLTNVILNTLDKNFNDLIRLEKNNGEFIGDLESIINTIIDSKIEDLTNGDYSPEDAHEYLQELNEEIMIFCDENQINLNINQELLEDDYSSTIDYNPPPEDLTDIFKDRHPSNENSQESYSHYEDKIDNLFSK
jgi:hypothetical protein